MQSDARRRIWCGDFEIDLEAGELRKNGKPVRLQDQPFRILKCLIERPGALVTREELRHEIWGDDVHVDFDRSLNTSVARLREALGDSPTRPAYVETVPRKGYRFIGGHEPPTRRARRFSVATTWRGGLAVVSCAVLGAGVWSFSRSAGSLEDVAPTLESVTYYEGVESEASFAPGGHQLAFTWNGPRQDNFDIYVKTIEGAETVRLTTDSAREYSPAWSPDGQWIAFLRRSEGGRASLHRVPALGGREQTLAQVAVPERFGGIEAIVDRYVAWSPDSKALAYSDRDSNQESPSLFLLIPETETRRRLTRSPSGIRSGIRGDLNPAFSPDGRTLVFNGARGDQAGLYLLRLTEDLSAAGEPEFVDLPLQNPRTPAWLNDGELVVSAGSRLWRVDLRTNEASSFLDSAGYVRLPAASVDSSRLIYTETVVEANIWRIDLDERRRGSNPSKVVSSTSGEANLHCSPDGSRITFLTWRSEPVRPWICNADGSGQAPLTESQGGSPRWSPNGRAIAFDGPSEPGNQAVFDIWLVGPEGGAPKRFTSEAADHRLPSWSRDGEWIYFASDRGDGYQVWKRHVDRGEEKQITRKGGWAAIEGADGFVYYTKAADHTVWRVPQEGGDEVQILGPLLSFNPLTASDAGLYYMPQRDPDGRSPIMFYDFADGSTHEVYRSPKPLSNGISVGPGERFLLFSQIDREGSDLRLVENFR